MSNKEAVKHMPIEGIVKHYQRSIERSENDSKRVCDFSTTPNVS